jgi:glutaredoxin
MEILEPETNKFTIYSKSGCPNCIKVKRFLQENKILFTNIDCDEYLLENKEEFLQFIQNLAQKECRLFPMVFDNQQFIGGYNETVQHVENILKFDESF